MGLSCYSTVYFLKSSLKRTDRKHCQNYTPLKTRVWADRGGDCVCSGGGRGVIRGPGGEEMDILW